MVARPLSERVPGFGERPRIPVDGFVRTFLERDLPELGVRVPTPAMRRFWTMLGHWHGQI